MVGKMRRILQAMILAALWGSASTLAMTNEIAQSAAEKSNDVQLQAALTNTVSCPSTNCFTLPANGKPRTRR